MIIVGARSYGEILAFSGASRGLVAFVQGIAMPPLFILLAFQLVLFILGMFISASAIIMITAPLLFPAIEALGFDLLWFATLFLLNLEMGASTPPLWRH